MKLTPDLIEHSRHYVNPCKDRELDLRGNKIPAIENLGATNNQFDTIDFSDNDLKRLENFPNLPRLKCLLFNNNRISHIESDIGTNIPNINTIVLTNNALKELGDIDGLASLKKLEYLALTGNPLTHKTHYRLYLIFKLPMIRVLDYKRIKLQEREAANKMFRGKKGAAAREQYVKSSNAISVADTVNDTTQSKIPNGQIKSAEELQAIQSAILNAKSLDEINRLQEMLQSGTFNLGTGKTATLTNGNGPHIPEVEMDDE